MNYSQKRSLQEILSLDTQKEWDDIRNNYIPVGIDQVIIDGNTFRNYGQYRFIWEKTYAKSPTRSMSGAMGSMNSLATFLTPHLILDFSIMSIDDYRRVMQLHYERNEFTVECYDPIYNKKIKVKMYFATEQMAKLYIINRKRMNNDEWEDFLLLAGVHEYTVEMIGTNNDLDLVSLIYDYVYPPTHPKDEDGQYIFPAGTKPSNEAEEDVYAGEEVIVGANSTFPDNPPNAEYKFAGWVDQNGLKYTEGKVVTVNSDTTLYATWEKTTESTLAFNYGLAKVAVEIDPETSEAKPIYSRKVNYNESIGDLPIGEAPYYIDEETGKKLYPYVRLGWYRLPVENSKRVSDNELYWSQRDETIYLLHRKKSCFVTYVTNSDAVLPVQLVPYGDKVWLPTLTKNGFVFEGWYKDPSLQKPFGGTMPAKNITIYAKWEKEDK